MDVFFYRKLNDKINRLHCTSTFEEAITIHQRNIQRLAIEMFKIAKNLEPKILRVFFTFDPTARKGRTFLRPNVNSVHYGENSIRYLGPIVWDDMIPKDFKSIETLDKFRNTIKNWIPVGCPCFLCREYVGGVGVVTTFE